VGFGPGIGEVQITGSAGRIARGSFTTAPRANEILTLAEPPKAEPRILEAVTARGVDKEGKPVQPAAEFRGNERVWVVFLYEGADQGAAFTVRWYCEGNEMEPARQTVVITGQSGHGSAWIAAKASGALPPAGYETTICYGADTRVLGRCAWKVIGPPPTPAGSATPATSRTPRH
jgi:hypothetical protein